MTAHQAAASNGLRAHGAQLRPIGHLADVLEWDVRNWSAALDFWHAHSNQDLARCSALEVGCGNGGASLWLALQGAHVMCSDVDFPTETAVRQHRAHGVSDLIEYRAIDTTNIPYEDRFDVVVFRSVIGALGVLGGQQRQARAIAEMHKALKKGGELFFAENLMASPFHQFFRRRFVQWGTTWRYVSAAEVDGLFSAFSRVEYRTVGFAGAFGRSERQRRFLGILDEALLNHVVPERWRYIVVGIATK